MPSTDRIRLDELPSLPRAVFTDPIYFSKFQVKTGTQFRSFGRKSFGTTWTVTEITTTTSGKFGRVQHSIAYVRTLDDFVTLHSVETGEWKTLRFKYMSESARYRLAE